MADSNKSKVVRSCLTCGIEFNVRYFALNHPEINLSGRFCSRSCVTKKTGKDVNCRQCNSIFYAANWDLRRGRKACSPECGRASLKGKKLKEDHRMKVIKTLTSYEDQRGEKNYAWKGGVTPIHNLIRHSKRYKEWRQEVLQKDSYTCQSCGLRGGILQANHKKPFSRYPELRFDLNNGEAICVNCHRLTGTYGGRMFNYVG